MARHLLASGLNVAGEQVLIVNGAQHGLTVALMALLQPGDVIAVDALTYPGFKALALALHLELLPIPGTERGPDLDALAKLCRSRSVRAIYTMPTLHNPLGWVMDLEQRKQLVAIARHHDLQIIEDAAYAFLVENPPTPLAELAPERTLYVSGFSKSVAAGLRVGFIVAPAAKVAALERVIRVTAWNAPGVMTAITSAWLDDGTVSRLEGQKRKDAQRRQLIADEVLDGLHRVRHPSSYFVWLPLSEDARADQVAAALERQQVSVSTAQPFATSPHVPHAIRLALGSVAIGALREGLEKVRWLVGAYA